MSIFSIFIIMSVSVFASKLIGLLTFIGAIIVKQKLGSMNEDMWKDYFNSMSVGKLIPNIFLLRLVSILVSAGAIYTVLNMLSVEKAGFFVSLVVIIELIGLTFKCITNKDKLNVELDLLKTKLKNDNA